MRNTTCLLLGLILATAAPAAQKLPWSPEQATGEPDTPVAGDMKTAWATLEQNQGDEWLRLEYETPVAVQSIRIRETFNPGAVSRVTAFAGDGTEVVIWEGTAPAQEAPAVFEVATDANVFSRSVKVYLDTKRVDGWNEIDAVQLVGRDGSEQWAVGASASRTYASRVANTEQVEYTVEGLPPSVVRTVPVCGDRMVDPALDRIEVTFSKDMITERMWSFCQVSDETFPRVPEGREIRYRDDHRTCVLPVELEPDTTYVIWINRGRFNSFRDTAGHPSVPYLLVFSLTADQEAWQKSAADAYQWCADRMVFSRVLSGSSPLRSAA